MAKSSKYLKIYNYQYVTFFMIFSTFWAFVFLLFKDFGEKIKQLFPHLLFSVRFAFQFYKNEGSNTNRY
jgi:hypothetical protein